MTDKDIDFLYSVYVDGEVDSEYEKIFIEKLKIVYDQKKISEELNKKFSEAQEKLAKLNEKK